MQSPEPKKDEHVHIYSDREIKAMRKNHKGNLKRFAAMGRRG